MLNFQYTDDLDLGTYRLSHTYLAQCAKGLIS